MNQDVEVCTVFDLLSVKVGEGLFGWVCVCKCAVPLPPPQDYISQLQWRPDCQKGPMFSEIFCWFQIVSTSWFFQQSYSLCNLQCSAFYSLWKLWRCGTVTPSHLCSEILRGRYGLPLWSRLHRCRCWEKRELLSGILKSIFAPHQYTNVIVALP